MSARITPEQRVLRAMTEAELLKFVLAVARTFGWLSYHARPAWSAKGFRTPVQGDGKGFVDVVLVHAERGVIFAELKREQGELTPEQRVWLDVLEAAGARAYVWRPRDRGAIAGLLSGGRAAVVSTDSLSVPTSRRPA